MTKGQVRARVNRANTSQSPKWSKPEANLQLRLRSLANVFTKTNRILTGDRAITVRILDKNYSELTGVTMADNMPGMSKYPDIFLNSSAFTEIGKTSTLIGLLGLNYHELSHLMFTERGYKAWLSNYVINSLGDVGYAFNVLEDQRIESFFTALYEPAGKFFTETFVKFIMDDPNSWDRIFLYSVGRGYLPLEIREEFESRFIRPDLIDEIKKIVKDFKAIKQFPKQQNGAAVKLCIRFSEIISEIQPPKRDCDSADQQQGSANQQANDEAQKKDRKRQLKEDRTGEDQSNFWDDEDEEDGEEGEEEGSDSESDSEGDSESESDSEGGSDDEESGDSGDPSDDGDADGDGEGDSESEDAGDGDGEGSPSDSGEDGEPGEESSEEFDENEEEVDSSSGGPAGHSSSTSAFNDQELSDYLDEIQDAISDDESVQDEVGRIKTALNDNTDINIIDFGNARSIKNTPSPSSISTLRSITKDFRRLWAEVEPGWKYGSDIGKFNVGRAMRDPENFDEMFDEWDEGREQEVGLEAFIALDTSSSMNGSPILLASEAMWVIKRALDEVGAMTTVVGFDEGTTGLYDRNHRAAKHEWPLWTELRGDTAPAHSMKLANGVFSRTTLPNKLFVILTDGGWTSYDYILNETPYVELLDHMDATKMYVGVSNGWGQGDYNSKEREHFDFTAEVTNPLDIVPLVKKTITHMIQNRIR